MPTAPERLAARTLVTRRLAYLAVVALAVGVSCGGGSEGESRAPAQASPSPCALLQPHQVQAVVGNAVTAEQVFSEGAGTLAGAKICQYRPAQPQAVPAGPQGTLPTGVTVEVAFAYPREIFMKYRRANDPAGRLTPVPGLCTEAVWSETSNRVVALTGSRVIAVSLRGDPSAPGYRDKAVALASEALKRL